jgi:DNA-directed RNA polymerase subunit RPC12/RpoP
MSQNINGIPIIEAEPDFICSECGKITETRPYGHLGAEICAECGDKIPEIVKHNMDIKLFGDKGELM